MEQSIGTQCSSGNISCYCRYVVVGTTGASEGLVIGQNLHRNSEGGTELSKALRKITEIGDTRCQILRLKCASSLLELFAGLFELEVI